MIRAERGLASRSWFLYKGFIPLLASVLFQVLAMLAVGIGVPVFLKSKGYSNFVVGIVLMLPAVLAAAFRIFAGHLSDTRGRKILLISGCASVAIACVIYAATSTPWPYFIASIMISFGFVSFDTSSYALAGDLAPRARRFEGMSLIGVSWGVASMLAPILVLAFRRLWGFQMLFAIAGISATIAAGFAALLKRPSEVINRKKVLSLSRFNLQRAVIFPIVLYAAFSGTIGTFLVISTLKAGIGSGELFFAVSGAIVIIVRYCFRRLGDRHTRRGVIFVSSFGLILTLVIVCVSRNFATLLLGAAVAGISSALLWPAIIAFVIDKAPAEDRGTALGASTAAFDIAFSGSTIGFAALADVTGYQGMYMIAAIVLCVTIAGFAFSTRPGRTAWKVSARQSSSETG